MAKSATHWHRGEGEPRATNGQAQKVPCRPPQVDHKALTGRSAVKLQWSTTHEKSDLLKSINNEIGRYFGEKKESNT